MSFKNKTEKIIFKDKRFLKFYKIKEKIFPIYRLLEFFPNQGKLVDLGCGNGLLSGILALNYPKLEVLGIDADKEKIKLAKKTFNFDNISFIENDIVNFDYPSADYFSLIDVLYLIPFYFQDKIIKKISNKIKKDNGILIIKEMSKCPFYKYLFNYLQEIFSVKIIKRTIGSKFYFRDVKEMKNLLTKHGFKVSITKLDKGYLYPHILYKASKS